MSTREPQWLVRVPGNVADDARLKFSDKYVYGLVADHGPNEPISYADLCRHSKDGPDAARNAINNLIETGWLEVIEHKARISGRVHGSRYGTRKPTSNGDTPCAA